MIQKIALASDHAGFELKDKLLAYLASKNITVSDFGTDSTNSVDYADYAHPMAEAVESGKVEIGIAICGSGNGINMTTNKHKGIRGALCWNKEIAALARQHNDANICSLPARFITFEQAIDILNTFINTPFEGGRHVGRIEKIPNK